MASGMSAAFDGVDIGPLNYSSDETENIFRKEDVTTSNRKRTIDGGTIEKIDTIEEGRRDRQTMTTMGIDRSLVSKNPSSRKRPLLHSFFIKDILGDVVGRNFGNENNNEVDTSLKEKNLNIYCRSSNDRFELSTTDISKNREKSMDTENIDRDSPKHEGEGKKIKTETIVFLVNTLHC